MEFRVFVRDSQLVGISQRDPTAYFSFLCQASFKSHIVEQVLDFYEVNVKPRMVDFCTEMISYSMDLYIDVAPRHKIWLLDLNPWLPLSLDCLLFSWAELHSLQPFEFRVIENKDMIKPSDTSAYKVPTVILFF